MDHPESFEKRYLRVTKNAKIRTNQGCFCFLQQLSPVNEPSRIIRKTLLTGNRERQNPDIPCFFVPERITVTRKYDFVK